MGALRKAHTKSFNEVNLQDFVDETVSVEFFSELTSVAALISNYKRSRGAILLSNFFFRNKK